MLTLLVSEKLKSHDSRLRQPLAPLFVILWALQPQPSPRLLQALADRQYSRRPIDIRPLKRENLTAAGSRCEGNLDQSESPITPTDGAERLYLFGGQTECILRLGGGQLHPEHRVHCDQIEPEGFVQRDVENAGDVTNGSCRDVFATLPLRPQERVERGLDRRVAQFIEGIVSRTRRGGAMLCER